MTGRMTTEGALVPAPTLVKEDVCLVLGDRGQCRGQCRGHIEGIDRWKPVRVGGELSKRIPTTGAGMGEAGMLRPKSQCTAASQKVKGGTKGSAAGAEGQKLPATIALLMQSLLPPPPLTGVAWTEGLAKRPNE